MKTTKQQVLEHVLLGLQALMQNAASQELRADAAELASELNRRLAKEARKGVPAGAVVPAAA